MHEVHATIVMHSTYVYLVNKSTYSYSMLQIDDFAPHIRYFESCPSWAVEPRSNHYSESCSLRALLILRK